MRMSLFRDKGWENRGKWGPRAYSFLGLNYRMNELTAAVGIAQLAKMERVVRRRRMLGDLLTRSIRDIGGILPAPVAPGAAHSYWCYPFAMPGFDAERFVKALRKEGVPAGWGYTGKPIYLCHAALTEKKTFGKSGYPFVGPAGATAPSYREGLCPVAERTLSQLGVIWFNENWTARDIRAAAGAIRRAAATHRR